MADIRRYTNAISTARYGEEVRGSIVDAILAINDDVEGDVASTGAYAQAAQQSANAASTSASNAAQTAEDIQDTLTEIDNKLDAFDSAEQSRDSAEQSRVNAENARVNAEIAREDQESGYVAQARQYAQQAATYASSDYARLGESWAVGNTGVRYGEDTNNSKYWAEVAAQVVTEGGVASFNGRTGNVTPTAGDYDAEKITYGSGTVKSSLDSLNSGFAQSVIATDPISASLIDLYYVKSEVNALIQTLDDKIANLTTDLAYRSVSLQIPSDSGSDISWDGIYSVMVVKSARVCEFRANISLAINTSATTEQKIASLPEGYRPSFSRFAIILAQSGARLTLYMKSNGDVTVQNVSGAVIPNTFIRFFVSYICPN